MGSDAREGSGVSRLKRAKEPESIAPIATLGSSSNLVGDTYDPVITIPLDGPFALDLAEIMPVVGDRLPHTIAGKAIRVVLLGGRKRGTPPTGIRRGEPLRNPPSPKSRGQGMHAQ